jgi:cytochrome c oxidase assembly protein subunit 11
MSSVTSSPHDNRNRWVALTCILVVVGMVGMAYAAVPLYALFCRMTGFGGTTQVAGDNPKGVIDRTMTVRFDSNVDSGLGWRVVPAQTTTDPIGEVQTITYRATNLTSQTVTGTAVFNVTPERAGAYFNKIECFCFTSQTLGPNETVDMPVTFFVDPDLAENSELDTIHEITLSYTFYPDTPQGS